MATESTDTPARRYNKRRRAEQEQQTRQRITEAAVKLHGSVGPAKTTVSGVAKEAGVQRATVYRHFPDEESLFAACSSHYWATHPLPDPGSWSAISDPGERLRTALGEIYALYAETHEMLEKTTRDAPLVPAMAAASGAFLAYVEAVVDAIVAGRPERGNARRRVRAAVGHAVAFATWQSLVGRQEVSEPEAVALMAALVEAAGSVRASAPGRR
jgi:AcrR family transcriptional regulator